MIKERPAYSIIGKSVPKLEAVEKVTGKALYAADVHLPGLLHGRILRSPHPHARILRIDTSKAEALAGVLAVATAKDATPTRFGQFLRDRTVFALDKVRFVGEPVAAVAALDADTAQEALGLIEVEYQELPAVFDPWEAMQPEAPLIHEELPSYQDSAPSKRYGNVRNEIRIQRGDVERAFAEADLVYEDTYRAHAQHQGYIEPRACLAAVDQRGKITVWSSTKAPFRVRSNIADGLGLPLSKVRVIAPAVGGDFGGKGSATIEPIAALLALKSGHPVRIVMSRGEELSVNFRRHSAVIHLEVAARRDGTLLGIRAEAAFDAGAYSGGINGMAHACANLQGVYHIPNVDIVGYSVYTNNIPSGQVRAPGAPQTYFAIESHLDIIARKLGLDPWEIRRKNALREGDLSPRGIGRLKNVALRETIELAAERAAHELGPKTTNRGIGVACAGWALDRESGTATSASVKLNEDGTAVLYTGVTDNGGGQYTLMGQIVAEVLGLEPQDVVVIAADTDITPFETGTGGSDTTYRVGNTVKQAAEHVRQQLLELAAERLEADVTDLEIGQGKIYVKGSPQQGIPMAELARTALTSRGGPIMGISSPERQRWMDALQEAQGSIDAPVFCTQAAEVEVDPETGSFQVLRYVAAQDVGFALNPLSVRGQMEGALSNGLGYALTEEVKLKQGRVINPNLLDYKMPTALDMPSITPLMVEEQSDLGPFGAKGVGEPAITAVAAVIANAVYDAVGVRIKETPITPEKIREALREASEKT